MREFLRGAVRIHILHHACRGEVHGAWMAKELAEHGHVISPGTLYPALHRLESDGMLRSRRTMAGGRVLRVYRATPRGRRALQEAKSALRELATEVLA